MMEHKMIGLIQEEVVADQFFCVLWKGTFRGIICLGNRKVRMQILAITG